MHRDIHISNVVLHFPCLEPKPEDYRNPKEYASSLNEKLSEILRGNLLEQEFEVKIVDYGLSRMVDEMNLNHTPDIGNELMKAPELKEGHYDYKVDAWGIGIIFFMLVNYDYMFRKEQQIEWGKWFIARQSNYSIEALRFIHEVVLYNKERRLDARQILQHEYFSQDPNNLESIAQLLDNANLTLSCMCDPVEISGIFTPED